MTCRKKYGVYWNIITINIESFLGCHIQGLDSRTRIPSDISMGIHKTRGYPYHCDNGINKIALFCMIMDIPTKFRDISLKSKYFTDFLNVFDFRTSLL